MTEEAAAKPWSMARVVTASSAGTAFEWYDFFIFGSLTPVIAKVFLAGLDPTSALIAALALFAVGFAFRPLGAIIFGAMGDRVGRKATFLATVSLMGGATFAIGLLPTYATGRDRRPDPARLPAHLPGHCAGRRIWRRGDLRRRTCRRRQARRGDRLDPVFGLVRAACRLAGDLRHAHRGRRGSVCRVGVAGPVPGLDPAARDFGVDAAQAEREPGLRQAARRWRSVEGAAAAKPSRSATTSSGC